MDGKNMWAINTLNQERQLKGSGALCCGSNLKIHEMLIHANIASWIPAVVQLLLWQWTCWGGMKDHEPIWQKRCVDNIHAVISIYSMHANIRLLLMFRSSRGCLSCHSLLFMPPDTILYISKSLITIWTVSVALAWLWNMFALPRRDALFGAWIKRDRARRKKETTLSKLDEETPQISAMVPLPVWFLLLSSESLVRPRLRGIQSTELCHYA